MTDSTRPFGSAGAAAAAGRRAALAGVGPGAGGEPAGGPQSAELGETLRLAAAGDEGAWRALVDLYARRVFALARSRRLSPEHAEEVTQSVFVTAAQHIRSGEYTERGRFEAWLFRVAMNRVRDFIRKERRRAGDMGSPGLNGRAAAAQTESGPDGASLRSLRAAMDGLGDADREVVELRHHGGMGFKEIAALLDQPLGTVLARHHRALKKLKDLMEQIDCGEGAGSPAGPLGKERGS